MPRRTAWGGVAFDDVNINNGPTLYTIADHATLEAESAQPTIERIRGRLIFRLDSTNNTSTEIANFWVGVCCMDDGLVGTGNSPDPSVDFDYPWMWITAGKLWAPAVPSAGPVQLTGHRKEAFELDIRAKRIIRPNMGLYILITGNRVFGSADPDMSGIIRYLLKE